MGSVLASARKQGRKLGEVVFGRSYRGVPSSAECAGQHHQLLPPQRPQPQLVAITPTAPAVTAALTAAAAAGSTGVAVAGTSGGSGAYGAMDVEGGVASGSACSTSPNSDDKVRSTMTAGI